CFLSAATPSRSGAPVGVRSPEPSTSSGSLTAVGKLVAEGSSCFDRSCSRRRRARRRRRRRAGSAAVVARRQPAPGDRQADAGRDALTERARRGLDAGGPAVLGMPGTLAVATTEVADVVERPG